METNFDYLLEKREYVGFAAQAVEAEKSIEISPATCAILSRRALELAVRFVYSYDAELSLPYRDNVSSLIHEPTFRRIIEPKLFPMLKYTIHLGNVAVHTNNNIRRDESIIALRDLFAFCDWIDYSYSKEYSEKVYDESVLASGDEELTIRFKESIRIDNEVRKIKGLPIAGYDDETKRAYLEYPDGRREYVGK